MRSGVLQTERTTIVGHHQFYQSVRGKLLLLVLLALIPAIGLAVHRNLEQRRTAKARGLDTITALSKLIAANEAAYVKNSRQLLATLSEIGFLVRATDRKFCSVHFQNLLKLSPDYLNFGLIDSNGLLFASSVAPPEDRTFLGDRSYFERTVATRRFSIGKFQVGRLTGHAGLNFGYPIFGDDGQVMRVLFASLKLEILTQAATEVPLPQGAAVSVLDESGTVLARLPEIAGLVGNSFADGEFFQAIARTQKGVVQSRGLDGIERLYAVSTVTDGKEPGLFVTVGIPGSILFAEANDALWQSLLFLALMTFLILALAYRFAEKALIRPIDALVHATNRLASADLKARAPASSSTIELNHLSAAFNRMAESLELRERAVQQAQERIEAMNAQLEERVHERTVELTAAIQELESFSYSISHDLRAPLRHMDGFAGLLRKHDGARLDDKSKHYLDIISESARKMGTLIDDLLVFSRMGRQGLNKHPLEMEELVREVVAELMDMELGRRVQWDIDPLPCVDADRPTMKQVWINLISNALKYSKIRDVARVAIKYEAKGPEHLFAVRDNGVGFDMAYGDKLFGVFQRLHSEAEFEGTGIGLAIVRRIVARHGGKTWAESQPEQGATFYFSIPRNE